MPGWAMGMSVAVAVLAAATGFGLFWQRRNGRLRPVAAGAGTASREGLGQAPDGTDRLLLRELGVRADSPATLLQFSSAFCAPCRATRRLCTEVAALLAGVEHVEVDAESHLDAVRSLGVLRTPTLFVVDGAGRIVQRASGQPTRAHLIAAVAPLLPAGSG